MFYNFSQNNSGGVFQDDIGEIIIEADDWKQANEFAESKTPIYFNGCEDGRDCPCCGDRWRSLWEGEEGTPSPAIYGEEDRTKWKRRRDTHILIYYRDGTIEKIEPTPKYKHSKGY